MIPSNRHKRAILRDRWRGNHAHALLCRCPQCVDYGPFASLRDAPFEVLQGVTLVDDEGPSVFVRSQQLADNPGLLAVRPPSGFDLFLLDRYAPPPSTEGQRLFRAGRFAEAAPHLLREIMSDTEPEAPDV